MPLLLKMIKITGFLAPEGYWYGGLSSWLYKPGYYTSSDDQSSIKLWLSAELEGQGKTSREDFDEILGSTHYAKPKVAEDAAKMLQSVAKTAVKLAGDKPCIASNGYTLAVKRMADLDWQIVVNIRRTPQFLVRLFHTIDSEVQLAFHAIYSQMIEAQETSFTIDESIISSLCKEINIIFAKVKRGQVVDFNLPVDLKNNSTRENLNEDETEANLKKKQKRGEESSGRNFKQKQGTLDLLGIPEGTDFNSIFGDHPKENALIAKITNFQFCHHQKTGNSFTKTSLCIPFAVGMLCPKGKNFPNNHSLRKAVKSNNSQ